jgi:hypothetical protein
MLRQLRKLLLGNGFSTCLAKDNFTTRSEYVFKITNVLTWMGTGTRLHVSNSCQFFSLNHETALPHLKYKIAVLEISFVNICTVQCLDPIALLVIALMLSWLARKKPDMFHISLLRLNCWYPKRGVKKKRYLLDDICFLSRLTDNRLRRSVKYPLIHSLRPILSSSVALVRKRTIPTERPPLSAK